MVNRLSADGSGNGGGGIWPAGHLLGGFYDKKKNSGVHPRVATLILPSFLKKEKDDSSSPVPCVFILGDLSVGLGSYQGFSFFRW